MSIIHELAIPSNHSKQYPSILVHFAKIWFFAGQGISLIVGLGDYSGGELCVEDEVHDIRQARWGGHVLSQLYLW